MDNVLEKKYNHNKNNNQLLGCELIVHTQDIINSKRELIEQLLLLFIELQ